MMFRIATVMAISCVAFAAMAGEVIFDRRQAPEDAKAWESHRYPIGNGRLGAMLTGGLKRESVQFNVDSLWTGDKNISGATVTLGSALTYNGSEQTQSVSKIELSGTDITSYCEISGNKGTNAGSYTLTITAKADSNYTGSVTKSFTIA